MAEVTVYADGVYKLNSLGIWSFETGDGAAAARVVKVRKRTGIHEDVYLALITDKIEKGKKDMAGQEVYVLPGELPGPEVGPTYEMFKRPIEGMAAVSAGAGPAVYGGFVGNPLLILSGAAVIGSLGFLSLLPFIARKGYGAYRDISGYVKGEQDYYTGDQKWLREHALEVIDGLSGPADAA